MTRWVAILLLALFVPHAAKADICGKFEGMVKNFETQFGEIVTSTGLTKTNRLIIISSQRGTFTIIRVFPNGNACVIEYGTDYEIYVKKGKDT